MRTAPRFGGWRWTAPSKSQLWDRPSQLLQHALTQDPFRVKGTVAQPGWGRAVPETGQEAPGTTAASSLLLGTGPAHGVTRQEEGERPWEGTGPRTQRQQLGGATL